MNNLKKRRDRAFSLEPGAKVTGEECRNNYRAGKILFFPLFTLGSLAGDLWIRLTKDILRREKQTGLLTCASYIHTRALSGE